VKKPNHDSRSPSRELNPGPAEYEAGMLTTRPRHSVLFLLLIHEPGELGQSSDCLGAGRPEFSFWHGQDC
jgi:hypothetical protein